jgi:hypothetical protein
MPQVLHRSGELRQHEGILCEPTPEFEHIGVAGLEEEIVAEEACIDRSALEEEVLWPDRARNLDNRDALLGEGPAAGTGVLHADRGVPINVALNHEKVGLRAGRPEIGVDSEFAAWQRIEGNTLGGIDGEHVAGAAVGHADQAGIVELLKIDE